MRRVVVTGIGIVSSIGNNKQEVADSLKSGRSGIRFSEEYQQMGFRSQVSGPVVGLDQEALIDRKLRRFMGDAAAFNYVAMQEALTDSGLTPEMISNPRTA
jgi:3-oxoacyl-[acyl-carrier-protein] synthase I